MTSAKSIKPKTNWALVVWPILSLWCIAAIYVYFSEFRSQASVLLPVLMGLALFLVLIMNAVMGSIAQHRNVMQALDESAITQCVECGEGNRLLHTIEFHYYAYIVVWFIQFTRRGKFCSGCARKIADSSFVKTTCFSILFPPFILWAWLEKRSILKRIS